MERKDLPKGMMAILKYAAMEEKCVFEAMAADCGYERKTTFFSDFSIAECYGVKAIKDTFKRVMDSWSKDVKYWTELCLALNWKSWEWADREDDEFVELYSELYYKARNYALDNFKGKDLSYFIRVTD